MDYVELGYKPKENELLSCIKIKAEDLEKVANEVAAESSIGTWTKIKTMKKEVYDKLKPTVYEINEIGTDGKDKIGIIKIAYPLDAFEPSNMPGTLAGIAGNIFGMKIVKGLRILDFRFPEEFIKAYKGPKYGIKGIRDLLKVDNRPLVGTIVKPKVGLNTEEHSKVTYESWVGGCDIVKDDENLVSQDFNKFEDRIFKVMEYRDKAEDETGEKKIYMPNITAPYKEMIRRAQVVKDAGCEYAMLDVVVLGFSAVQQFREEDFDFVIHAHRAMHAAITRSREWGISMLALSKIYRLLGVDQLHIGTVVGKMEGEQDEVCGIRDEIVQDSVKKDDLNKFFDQEWYGMNNVFPVSSGGIYPKLVPKITDMLGKDVILQAGGGIHGHPDGTISGAKAMRAAVESVAEGISLEQKAEEVPELKTALEYWK
ncbi:MAG: ribulose-bisphosphate carboxylase large chain [Methanothermococcus sp.]|jgi:ribulose-bisphosphate carboxylase large chain|uniref:type III ribulose-bisphosphate carboxylase n=1 Tax=Methanothermococcus TaxID=155862 RepID=UPI000375BC3D|nr:MULTISPECIES: type III ribulose-bisphosphate carboxylase [Methanothermococcus]MDK2790928.1 ribulose-bisphosphate carboxylase large chain [Methanothermococcus sp.]MDK2987558.1 ribulose-bisphosphate carboxylase large chain [Methanothermococcus sp.]